MAINIIQRKSPNYSSRNNWKPDLIINHITEGNFLGAVSWLTNPKSKVSSHFVISRKGEVYQLVDLTQAAWSQGTTNSNDSRDNKLSELKIVRDRKVNVNNYGISIENEGISTQTKGSLTNEQLNANIELTNWIIQEVKRIYGINIIPSRTTIVGHKHIAPRWKPNCPGSQFPYDTIIKGVIRLLDIKNYETSMSAIKQQFEVNNTVKIKKGAVYGGLYKGTKNKPVPESRIGSRVTIGRIATHDNEEQALIVELNSWIATKYLES